MAKRRDQMLAKAKQLQSMGPDKDCTLRRVLSFTVRLADEEEHEGEFISTLEMMVRLAGAPGTVVRKQLIRVPLNSSAGQELELVRKALSDGVGQLLAVPEPEPAEAPAPAEPEPVDDRQRCPHCKGLMYPTEVKQGPFKGRPKCTMCGKTWEDQTNG